jgi:hypothetical protein
VTDALAVPVAAGALVLCVAGAAKLTSPGAAVRALERGGLSRLANAPLVRLAAVAEAVIGCWTLSLGGRSALVALASAYAVFGGLSLWLRARSAACGCFGENDSDTPVGVLHVTLNAALALVGVAAALAPPPTLVWLAGHRSGLAASAAAAAAGACAYGIVLAYSLLPAAWNAWSPQ